jgi:hypothetical protein
MSSKSTAFLKRLPVLFVLVFAFVSFKGDKDALHKRVFNVSLYETKDGVISKKTIADKFYFKEGKMFSDYLNDKFGYKWIRYRINKDSIYTDSTDTEVRLLVVQGSATDEDNQTVTIDFETVEWDIDGSVKITKNDKLKKYYDFSGREKGGKPKKVKKKKKDPTKQPLIEVKTE